ncbi:AAA family ATPase [Escherichia coli]|uniref:ATP-dependent Clp protease ATP-binding subunit n=2 Tax=root TaxID=1 RepID=A0AAU7PGS1_9CAUD|nr:ATP-dependent Clp protease ATP-binding subunit [Escherichia coli]QAY00476.1 ClpA-like protein [Escherichia phage Ecwhy_1]WGM49558.1 ATP-dependent protease [Escherichia phage vB_Ec-M-J]EGE5776312.1 ATP-dependent Clp protease ATP-binding subunit [Escherichia coli]ELW0836238.1 ATP-dependent Clp protease ATP-binding subunit [Escherichia coli]VVY07553.1 ATP-dependent Clp protease ATP-binding subunit ClpA [Escherichia coli]
MNLTQLFKKSDELATSLGHTFLTIDHLSATVLTIDSIKAVFEDMNIDADNLHGRLIAYLKNTTFPHAPKSADGDEANRTSLLVNRVVQELSKKSVIEQLKRDDFSIDAYFVLFECLSFPNTALEAALREEGITCTEAARTLQKHVEAIDNGINLQSISDEPTGEKKVAQQQPSSKQKGLEDYTTNLTALAKEGKLDPMIGRQKELSALIETLARKTKKNAILTGEAGVGKTQIIDGLAQAIADGEVPEHLKDVEILSLNVGALTAGTKYRGEFEERIDNLLKELKKRENTIVFIDEIHIMVGAGSASNGSMDMSNMLKPALSRGEIRVIGATTYDEYRKNIEKDSALTRRFMKIDVVEPTIDETRAIVNGLKSTYETFHNVEFSTEAMDAVITLSDKFLKNKHFPDKAIDLMDAAAAKVRSRETDDNIITVALIQEVVAGIANLDINVVACTESERMRNLPDALRSRVYGQEEAVQKLVDNVMVARAGLRDKSSVQGAFMFVGPSGTGKTEITKALADATGSELIRFDMSEFSQEHTVAKLIGSPPGYVGHDSGNGLLLDKIEQFPNAVLLLDEIEKADRKVLLTFLQVLDEGRLTGSQGKTVYFNNVTVIMTTNLGAADSTKRSIGMSGSDTAQDKAIKAFLPPEFINRIDSIVTFKDLSSEAIDSIIDKFMGSLNEQIKDRKVKVSLTKAAREWLATNGVKVGMGARPMKRTIEQNIRVPLAKEMLCGSLVNGGNVTFDVIDGKLAIKPKRTKAVEKVIA